MADGFSGPCCCGAARELGPVTARVQRRRRRRGGGGVARGHPVGAFCLPSAERLLTSLSSLLQL